MRQTVCLAAVGALAMSFAGCSESGTDVSRASRPTRAVDYRYVEETAPAGEKGVIELREVAADGDEVVIVGRIGGSENPWVEGRAAFSIVDLSLPSCTDCGSDGCPKPWDFC